jgi:hypothetical protein
MSTGVILELPNAIRDGAGNWTKEVELDEMGGEEEDILADQSRETGGTGVFKKSGSARITSILSRCTVRVGATKRPEGKDRYDLPDFFEKVWQLGFSSDRIFTMVRLRQLSLGNVYRFDKNCPVCKKEIKGITIPLDQLEVTSIPMETAAELDRKIKLPRSQDVVIWKFFQGIDEDEQERIMKEHEGDFISAVLYRRIRAVHPWDAATASHLAAQKPEGGLLYTKRMRSADRRFLGAEMDAAEGGIDTDIQITCDNSQCRTEFTTKLQVMGSDFFFPSVIPSGASSTNAPSLNVGDGLQTSLLESPSVSETA